MKLKGLLLSLTALSLVAGSALAAPRTASAHCDTRDGPVVEAATKALEMGNPNLVLIWVQPKDEAEVRAAFDHALKVRRLGPEARTLADEYFFETLVRVHRAGENAPYTGLKVAEPELPVLAADHALAAGSPRELLTMLETAMHEELAAQFSSVAGKSSFDPNDVAAGRAYVEAYVQYVHWVEGVFDAIHTGPEGGHVEAAAEVHGH